MKEDDGPAIGPEFAYVEHGLNALNEGRYAEAIRLLDNGLNQHVAQSDNLDLRGLARSVSVFINYLEFRLEEDFGLVQIEGDMPEQVKLEMRCSFCGERQSEERKLIAGPTAFICEQCAKACVAELEK